MTGATVHARGWSWRYATRRRWAVSDASFRIEPGERVLLLGASGAGKSTLLRGLAGVLGDEDEGEQRGELTVDGASPSALRGRTGLVLQDPDTQVVLARVGDDVAFGCENLGVPRDEIWTRVGSALDAVGLDVSWDRSTSALSGGQKQRLALAGVLAMQPGLILLDEPTANLDPAGVAEVRDAVARVLDATGATLVVVEHRIDVWLPLIDRVIVLASEEQGGGVIADGPAASVLASQGAALAADGVWVPGIALPVPPPPRTMGTVSLSGERLVAGRSRTTPVVGPLDVEVREGEALGIVGPNGAGKSTLGLTLAGLLPPVSGEVVAAAALADGAPRSPIRWSARQLLTRIGTVLQEPEHQLLTSTVRAELEVGPRALGLPADEIARRVDALLERTRLTSLAAANPYTLSGGQKRRLTVAAMIATRPRVAVLDEPTFGQDARTWTELTALMAEVRDEGTALVVISHDEAVLQALHARRLPVGGGA